MDFCYVKRDTVEYYLHRRAPVEEFNENGDLIQTHPGCYVLIFKFVRMDGVAPELSDTLALQ